MTQTRPGPPVVTFCKTSSASQPGCWRSLQPPPSSPVVRLLLACARACTCVSSCTVLSAVWVVCAPPGHGPERCPCHGDLVPPSARASYRNPHCLPILPFCHPKMFAWSRAVLGFGTGFYPMSIIDAFPSPRGSSPLCRLLGRAPWFILSLAGQLGCLPIWAAVTKAVRNVCKSSCEQGLTVGAHHTERWNCWATW